MATSPTVRPRRLCLFCGSRTGSDPAYAAAAKALGAGLGARGITLIYGGGRVGLMGIAADAALSAGGEVVGVIPDFLRDRELGHGGVTDLIITDSMHSRKRHMFELADGFVVLPGGLGTLDETFEMATWAQLDRHAMPIWLVDIAGFWQPLDALLRHVVKADFAGENIYNALRLVPDVPSLLALLDELPPAE